MVEEIRVSREFVQDLQKRIQQLESLVLTLQAENKEYCEALNEMDEELSASRFERYD